MKCTVIIDEEREEEIVVYAHKRGRLTERIQSMAEEGEDPCEIIAYLNGSAIRLSPTEPLCFISEGGKVFAVTEKGRLAVKERLYSLEERLGDAYIKLSQSCLANAKKIRKFDASLAGSLFAVFDGGYRECISRRQITAVKNRFFKKERKKSK